MATIDLKSLKGSQLTIAQTFTHPLFVEAGAGSGKTFTLTKRIAWALCEGSGSDGKPYLDDLSQVLVITFTSAAAREIKERVRRELRSIGLKQAALEVDNAWISTIHGMCERIIKRHALDLGVDPHFKILVSNEQVTLYNTAIEQTVKAAQDNAAPDSMMGNLFDTFDIGSFNQGDRPTGILGYVSKLCEIAHMTPLGFDGLTYCCESDYRCLVFELRDIFETMSTLPGVSEKAKPIIEETLKLFKDLPKLPSDLSDRCVVSILDRVTFPSSSKALGDVLTQAKELYASAQLNYAMHQANQFIPCLLQLAKQADTTYKELKIAAGKLDNDDLITLAHDAVLHKPIIAKDYEGRFKLVMVDEFQDTDAKQLALISKLAGTKDSCLTTVGDSQQSIYKFRGADVSVFFDWGEQVKAYGAQHHLKEDETNLKLNINFRSHADILSLVDKVCGGEEGVLDTFMHLDPNPNREDAFKDINLPRVNIELCRGQKGGKGSAAQRITKTVAEMMAARFREFKDAGVPASDMALLLGVTTNTALYLDALRNEGLECVVTGGSTFTRTAEVQVMCALLYTLANPHDTKQGLFPLLTSPLFELDANDFLVLGTGKEELTQKLRRQSIDIGLLDEDPKDKNATKTKSRRLLEAQRILCRAFTQLDTMPVADVCLYVVKESGWLSRLEMQGTQGQSQQANILAAIDYIRQLTDDLGLGPARAAHEFALWLSCAKVPPAALAKYENNFVQVMTIHASKGLEFPLVGLSECWSNPRADSGFMSTRTGQKTRQIVLKPSDKMIPGKGTVSDLLKNIPDETNPKTSATWCKFITTQEKQAEYAEKARLLYVGLTRAREALVIGMPLGKTSSKPISEDLAAVAFSTLGNVDKLGEGTSYLEFGGTAPARFDQVVIKKEENLAVLNAKDDPQLENTNLGSTSSLEQAPSFDFYSSVSWDFVHEGKLMPLYGPWYSFSQIHELDSQNTKSYELEVQEENEESQPRDADEDKATNLGSAFHLLAQKMVEANRPLTETDIKKQERAWELSLAQSKRLRKALDLWAGSKIRAHAMNYPVRYSELPFGQQFESLYGNVRRGAFDLVCMTRGKHDVEVFDYKTGDLNLSQDEIYARHFGQAVFYASVLLAQGYERVRVSFVCVEVNDPMDTTEPLVVRFEFDQQSRLQEQDGFYEMFTTGSWEDYKTS